MTHREPADRLLPWLMLGALVLTLSGLALRDRLELPQPLSPEPVAAPMLMLPR